MAAIPDVLVVGSGVSGLFAAKQLKEKGLSVVVVEAADYIGGRILQVEGFVPWLYDVGGEIIHAEETPLHNMAVEQKWDIQKIFYSYPRYPMKPDDVAVESWYLGREKKFVSWKNDDPDITKLWTTYYKLCHEDKTVPRPNVSMLKFWVDQGVPQRVLGIGDALLGKIWVTNLDKLGIAETKQEEAGIEHGYEINYQVKKSFKVLIDHLKDGLTVHLDWQAKSISYKGKECVVTNQRGQQLKARRILVTVPVSILKDKDIKFDPPLPPAKLDAIAKIGWGTVLKVILKMSTRFWPADRQLTVCADCLVPQVWSDGGPARGLNAPYTVTGFVGGDVGATLGACDDDTIARAFLRQLDEMYGTPAEPNPATKAHIGTLIFNWGKMPFVRGGYSYPSLNSLGSRKTYANPIHGKLFFAGEATTHDGSGTIAGAMGTSNRVVKEILEHTPKSKL